MATIYLSLSKKSDSNPNKEIRIRFKHGKIDQQAKTNIFIPAEYWDETAQQIIVPNFRIKSDEKKELKQYLTTQGEKLNILTSTIQSTFNQLDKDTIAPDWLKTTIDIFNFPDKYAPKTEASAKSFFELYDDFLINKTVSPSTLEKRRIVCAALLRFEQHHILKLDFTTITADTLKEFEDFLRNENEYDETQPPRGTNTIAVMLKIVRTFCKWCNDNEYTDSKPFAKYKAPSEKYGTPYYLSIDERNILYNFDLSDRPALERQRDIFVFQCHVGCRVGDLYSLTKENLINGAVEYVAAKTKGKEPRTIRVPLNSTATEIVEKYAGLDGEQLLPLIAEQKYNEVIKDVFAVAGITRNVTVLNPLTRMSETKPLNELASSHLARRTFCGNLYKKVKDPNLVGSLSGHAEDSKAFTRYRDIDEEDKKELVKMLE